MGSKASKTFDFQADLLELSKKYYDLIIYVRETHIFKQRNSKLQKAVDEYLKDYRNFDPNDKAVACVDMANKLHPLNYGTDKVNKEYLIQACLRQEDFCRKLHVKCITYEGCLEGYIKFLSLVKQRPGKITVPNLAEDFMWHSHMQDNEKYKKDTKRILGRVLNHDDEISKEKLKECWDDAKEKRQQKYPNQKVREYSNSQTVKNKGIEAK